MSDTQPPIRVRPEVLQARAYRQGAAPSKPGFKLSSNENPFDPLPGVLEAIAERSRQVNRYAAVAMPELRAELAREFDASADHVHLASGSVAILYQLVQAVAGPGEEFVHAWPSFEAYPSLGLASGARAVAVPLGQGARHDLDAMAEAVTDRTRAVLVCSPNNPTGPAVGSEEFARFMSRVPDDVLVVLDEAYRDFVTEPNAVHGEAVLGTYENLVVLRTFSKNFGLAGLRIGYGVGSPAVWATASAVAIPLSVTGIAESAALASLEPVAREENARRIGVLVERRERLVSLLRGLGIEVPEAQGNFVWIPEGAGGVRSAADLAAAFAADGTLVRPFPDHGVRISVGEEESLEVVERVVREFLGG